MQRALAAYSRGDHAEAELLCRSAVESLPNHVGALSLLGILAARARRAEEAEGLLARVVVLAPGDVAAHNNYGNVLRELGRYGKALGSYDRALALAPEYVDAHYNRGVALQDLGRYEEALASYERVTALEPRHAAAWNNHGTTLRVLGRQQEALASYDRALAIRSDYAEANNNRGVALQELGRLDEAVTSYERALTIRADYAEAHNNRGGALRRLQRREEALASYERAIALRPNYAEAHNGRGVVLHELERFEEALGSYERAVGISPRYAEALTNRGSSLKALRRYEDALASLRAALDAEPAFFEAHRIRVATLFELKRHEEVLDCCERALALRRDPQIYMFAGAALQELKRFEEAIESYEQAIALADDLGFLLGTCRHVRTQICDWTDFDRDLARLEERIESGQPAASPFIASTLLDSARLQRKAAEVWVLKECAVERRFPPIARYPRHDRLRIGYFSADFRNHAVAALTAELFETHDRSRFEITAFSLGPDVRDGLRERVEPAFDRFLSVGPMSDREIASLARELEIDIAVDLGGYTGDARPRIMLLRAAPVQVCYLGYLGTMGSELVDYLVADPILVPQQERKHYAEKIAYLPSYQVNDSKRPVATKEFGRAELGLPDSGFVFCCFNANFKITPACFDSWMRILSAVPQSVLFLFGGNRVMERNLRAEAKRRGVAPERLVFGGRLPIGEYLARFRAADLFLDTWPYNAGTTASDALWVGLPVLTRIGNAFAARIAASVLTSAGLPELIAHDCIEYERLAIELAREPERLAVIRQRVAAARSNSALFDTPRFTRSLEALYELMYARHLAGLPPDHLEITHAAG